MSDIEMSPDVSPDAGVEDNRDLDTLLRTHRSTFRRREEVLFTDLEASRAPVARGGVRGFSVQEAHLENAVRELEERFA